MMFLTNEIKNWSFQNHLKPQFLVSRPCAIFYLFDGSMTVDAGAATLLMVVFFSGLETCETATGMAVVYSTPEVPDTGKPAAAAAAPYPSSPRISSRMVDIESLRVLAS